LAAIKRTAPRAAAPVTTIGLVGASGSGKSTLIDILVGLVKPNRGEFIVNNNKINEENRYLWRNQIGFVPQGIFLLDGTIRNNVAFGLPESEIDDSAVLKAVKMAHLEELIKELPDGINSKVGERGVQLSGGQIQRIGIARALYNDPDLIVLDEATSALDGLTEKVVMEAINDFSGEKSIVMVAHRLSTVKSCDTIYLMDKGKIVDYGNFNELTDKNPQFKKMAENS
jgi:HlyD family secretion protein|tara:strand:- start:439 stop:1119 length:681 start_codon:yes stop_codon:yes gene_type:complete